MEGSELLEATREMGRGQGISGEARTPLLEYLLVRGLLPKPLAKFVANKSVE